MNTSNPQGVAPSTVPRVIHAALVGGCVLFALVIYFVVRPQRSDAIEPGILYALLGAAVAAIVLAFAVLKPRIPLKSTNESADLFWTRASAPALIAWSVVEGGALLSIVAYMLSGSAIALGTALAAIAALAALHPGRIERA
jgi:hypothetical protein